MAEATGFPGGVRVRFSLVPRRFDENNMAGYVYTLFLKLTIMFTVNDFSGSGHYLVRNLNRNIGSDSYLATITYKVGYMHMPGEQIPVLISMTDGWSRSCHHVDGNRINWHTKQDMVNHLNTNGNWRFATMDEVVRVIKCQPHRVKQ